MSNEKDNSLNPHWIGNIHCRDYKIGNIILRDVPDDFVLYKTSFHYRGTGFNTLVRGNVDEFTKDTKLEIKVDDWWKATRTK